MSPPLRPTSSGGAVIRRAGGGRERSPRLAPSASTTCPDCGIAAVRSAGVSSTLMNSGEPRCICIRASQRAKKAGIKPAGCSLRVGEGIEQSGVGRGGQMKKERAERGGACGHLQLDETRDGDREHAQHRVAAVAQRALPVEAGGPDVLLPKPARADEQGRKRHGRGCAGPVRCRKALRNYEGGWNCRRARNRSGATRP